MFLARRKVDGKEKRRKRGRRRRRREKRPMHVGGPRSWLCSQTMHLKNLGAVCAAEYEHNLARYTRTHLSLFFSLYLSVCLLAGLTSREPYGSPYAAWTVWPMRGEVREAFCSNFVPNKTNSLKGAAPRIQPPLRGENLSPNFT